MMRDDIEKVVFSEEQIQEKIVELGRQITEDYKDVKEEIYCVGILKGAVNFYTDLVQKIDLPVRYDFMIASSYGNGTSTTGSVKILKLSHEVFQGEEACQREALLPALQAFPPHCGCAYRLLRL